MEQVLERDFTRADECSIAIETKQLSINEIPMLKGLIERVRDDISILDKETKKILDEKNIELNKINIEKRTDIDERTKNWDEDSYSENEIIGLKLWEDYKRYRKELTLIKQLCTQKKWL